ncbi:MAG TPA: nitronate monooxygenase [Bacillota bacterium]|nr:nitronate monooxygenase [Bacillota bacterium]
MYNVCGRLNITYPIIQGGMGNISNAPLAAAVSEAGGLGMIGCGTMPASEVESIIIETKNLTSEPFGINIAINVTKDVNTMIELAIKHHIPVISLSAGNPAPYISRLKKENICVIVVIASVKHAIKAAAHRVDMLVAEGVEAAGINATSELTTFTLIPQISCAVDIPVLAAGGIGDGKGLAAAMALGASGVQMGTRLIATKEAPFHETYKTQIIQADATDAVLVGRKTGPLRRVLKTPFIEKLHALEKDGISTGDYRKLTAESNHRKGALEGDVENGFMNSGQVAGLITDIPTVNDLFRRMIEDASRRLETSSHMLQGIVEN